MTDLESKHITIADIFDEYIAMQIEDCTPEDRQQRWPIFYQGSSLMLLAMLELLSNKTETKQSRDEQFKLWMDECKQNLILLQAENDSKTAIL